MSKRQAGTNRGLRGLTGRKGSRGERGARGATGKRGERGQRGERGPAGPVGPLPNRADILAMVEDQFRDIKKEMGIHLSRMGQIQVQLDQIHRMVKRLVHEDD